MALRKVLLLGNPQLHEVSEPVFEEELENIRHIVKDLHDTLLDFRCTYGVKKRLIYMHIAGKPTVFINPVIDMKSSEMFEVWDDCLCFPDLLVRVERHKSCRISYRDEGWNKSQMQLEGSLSELLQHEFDHLDGILAVSRAIDGRSFSLKSQKGKSA